MNEALKKCEAYTTRSLPLHAGIMGEEGGIWGVIAPFTI